MKIEIKALNKNFDEKILFDNFDLTIDSGDFIGIYGESGSGKTTLLNIIGLIENYEGSILYDEKAYTSNKDKRKLLANDIGFIFQNYGLIDNKTVFDNLKYLKKIHKLSNKAQHKAIDAALEQVGLAGFKQRKIYSLSGGEQQRVAIARILLKKPRLVLVDEPTASLDEANAKIILNYLQTINEAGSTVIIVSHDQNIIDFTNKKVSI